MFMSLVQCVKLIRAPCERRINQATDVYMCYESNHGEQKHWAFYSALLLDMFLIAWTVPNKGMLLQYGICDSNIIWYNCISRNVNCLYFIPNMSTWRYKNTILESGVTKNCHCDILYPKYVEHSTKNVLYWFVTLYKYRCSPTSDL